MIPERFRASRSSSSVKVRSSNFLSLRQEIRHFWRQHESAPIVALEKLDNGLRALIRHIFLDEMTSRRIDLKLEFACHGLKLVECTI